MDWLLSLAGPVLSFVAGLFGGKSRDDEIALGRAQQQVETHKADLAVIDRANKAAQSEAERKVERDENDLDKVP